jgi:hypothetical protein
MSAPTPDEIESDLHSTLQIAGIDPTLIITVIETILGLLGQCRNRQATAAAMRAPSARERVLVRRELQRELRERGQTVSRPQLDQLTEQVLQASRQASTEQRDRVVEYASEFQTI